MEGVNIFEEKDKRASTDLWCATNLQCVNLHAPFFVDEPKNKWELEERYLTLEGIGNTGSD